MPDPVVERHSIMAGPETRSRDLKSSDKRWCVYIVRCADETLYTGISNDLAARVACHNAGQGAKYTRSRRPVRLVYEETVADRSAAQQREYALRKLKPRQKQTLIASAGVADD
jgi:putative endonuclease